MSDHGGRPRADSTFVVQLGLMAIASTAVNAIRPMTSYRALSLGADPVQVGIITAAFSLAPAILAIWIGRRVDSWGEARVLALAMVTCAIGSFGSAIADSLLWLGVSQVVIGLGFVTILIAGQALVANTGGREARDARFGAYTMMGSIGQLAGPLIAIWLIERVSFGQPGSAFASHEQAPAFVAAAIAYLVALALAVRLISRTRPPDRKAGADPGQEASSVRTVLGREGMALAMATSMIVVTAIDLLIAYLPLYGEDRGLPVAVVGVLLGIRAGASLASRFGMPFIIRRFGRGPVLTASMAIAAAALAITPLSTSVPVLGVLMVLVGLGLGVGQPMTIAWVANQVPRAERGTALGVRLSGNRIALLSAPLIAGSLAGFGGVNLIFVMLAVSLASGAVVTRVRSLD